MPSSPKRSRSANKAAAPGGHAAAALPQAALAGWQLPVEGNVLQGFGWAYSPVFADWQEHTGVDLAAPEGAPVRAPADAVVLAVRHDALWGWVVSLALSGGYSSNVSALETVQVAAGQHVAAGAVLGEVGPSPPAEGNLAPHVFWQVFEGTTPVNPLR